jgi:hypothetical protein
MKKKSVGLLELETAVLECFLEKTPLSPLGVKQVNSRKHSKKFSNIFSRIPEHTGKRRFYFIAMNFEQGNS